MYNKVDTNMNFVDREKETEKFWRENDIFKKSMESGFRKSYFISRRLICPADRSAVWQSPEYLQ